MRLSDEILGGFGGGLKSLILSRLSDFWIIRRREDEKLEIDLKFWIVVRRLGADLNVLKCIYTYSFNLAPRSFNCRLARGRSSCSLQVPYTGQLQQSPMDDRLHNLLVWLEGHGMAMDFYVECKARSG